MSSIATPLARRKRQDHQTDFFLHPVGKEDLFKGHKPKTTLPDGIAPGTIICLVEVKTNKFEGKAILLQKPIKGLEVHDWEKPEDHGIIVRGGFLSHRCSMRANGCAGKSLYCLLRKHFNDKGLIHLGWDPITNKAGKVTKLIIISTL